MSGSGSASDGGPNTKLETNNVSTTYANLMLQLRSLFFVATASFLRIPIFRPRGKIYAPTLRLRPHRNSCFPELLLLHSGTNPAHVSDFPVVAGVERDAICGRGLQRIRRLDSLSHNADKCVHDVSCAAMRVNLGREWFCRRSPLERVKNLLNRCGRFGQLVAEFRSGSRGEFGLPSIDVLIIHRRRVDRVVERDFLRVGTVLQLARLGVKLALRPHIQPPQPGDHDDNGNDHRSNHQATKRNRHASLRRFLLELVCGVWLGSLRLVRGVWLGGVRRVRGVWLGGIWLFVNHSVSTRFGSG